MVERVELHDCAHVKEAWLLTKAKFTELALTTDQPYRDAVTNTPHNASIARQAAVERAEMAHAKSVIGALKGGADVPDKVLADYADWHRLKEHLRRQTGPST